MLMVSDTTYDHVLGSSLSQKKRQFLPLPLCTTLVSSKAWRKLFAASEEAGLSAFSRYDCFEGLETLPSFALVSKRPTSAISTPRTY